MKKGELEGIAVVCRISAKRRALLDADPNLVEELVEARFDEVPGLLNLDTAWDALAALLGESGAAATGEGGVAIGKDLGVRGAARVLSVKEVRDLASKLPADSGSFVRERAKLVAPGELQGAYLRPAPSSSKATNDAKWEEDVAELATFLVQLGDLYREAAKRGEQVLVAIAAA